MEMRCTCVPAEAPRDRPIEFEPIAPRRRRKARIPAKCRTELKRCMTGGSLAQRKRRAARCMKQFGRCRRLARK